MYNTTILIICMHKYLNTYYHNTIMPKSSKPIRETTSIKVNPELWKQVKIHCIQNNIEVSEFLEQLIKKELKIK